MNDENEREEGEEVAVQKNEDGSYTYVLQYPVEFKKELLTEIRLRRPTGADMEAMDLAEGAQGKSLRLLASISRLPLATVKKFDASDIHRLDGIALGMVEGKL